MDKKKSEVKESEPFAGCLTLQPEQKKNNEEV